MLAGKIYKFRWDKIDNLNKIMLFMLFRCSHICSVYVQEKGDIAFLNEKTVLDFAENIDDFELLCPVKEGDPALTIPSSYGPIPSQRNVIELT